MTRAATVGRPRPRRHPPRWVPTQHGAWAMLVVPFGQDQPDNARRCVRLGVARTVTRPAYTPSRIAREISRLLEDPSYASRAAEVGAQIRSEQGVRTACDAIEAVLTNGAPRLPGGSPRSRP